MKIDYRPELSYYEVKARLDRQRDTRIENDRIYHMVEALADKAFPSYEDQSDRRWENYYLPVRREGKRIAVPILLMEYRKEYYGAFHQLGTIHVREGHQKADKFWITVFDEIMKFIPVIRSQKRILEKVIPYDIRTGRVKGRYLMEKLLSESQKNAITRSYERHLGRNLKVVEVSLNQYLEMAAMCYKAAFSRETAGLSPIEMYKKWADGRDGGMLAIKNWDSREEFSRWLRSKVYAGAHPFEIVFSWIRHGIHLYPPCDSSPWFTIMVTNYGYTPDYLKMVKTLIKAEAPFRAHELDEVLAFLSGESYFTVNDYDDQNFSYYPSREYKEKFFRYIEWDEIKTLRWKDQAGELHCSSPVINQVS